MSKNTILTLENYREHLTIQPADFHTGYVKGYKYLFTNQPENLVPPTGKEVTLFYLVLEISPIAPSELKVVYIEFVAEGAAITPISYGDGNGYVTKPLSQYTAILDFLKMAKEANTQSEVLLQTNTVNSDVFVLM